MLFVCKLVDTSTELLPTHVALEVAEVKAMTLKTLASSSSVVASSVAYMRRSTRQWT